MIYALIHGAIVVGKKVTGATTYEKVILVADAVIIALMLLSMMQ